MLRGRNNDTCKNHVCVDGNRRDYRWHFRRCFLSPLGFIKYWNKVRVNLGLFSLCEWVVLQAYYCSSYFCYFFLHLHYHHASQSSANYSFFPRAPSESCALTYMLTYLFQNGLEIWGILFSQEKVKVQSVCEEITAISHLLLGRRWSGWPDSPFWCSHQDTVSLRAHTTHG